jgi:hypothetical protein
MEMDHSQALRACRDDYQPPWNPREGSLPSRCGDLFEVATVRSRIREAGPH